MSIYLGTSGWRYKAWGKKFYPINTKQEGFLPFYSGKFNTVEINSSFYHLPRPSTFEHWRDATPTDFLFAVKLSRFITHVMRLYGTKKAVDNFVQNAACLDEKLGPILVQLPPNFKIDLKKVKKLFDDFRAAEKKLNRKLMIALEVRHKSWYAAEVQNDLLSLLTRYNVALVFGHSSKYPYPQNEPITANFVYLRFHGPKQFAGSLYGKRLASWVPKMRRWSKRGLNVFAYFNNDQQAYAIKDVTLLFDMLHG